AGRRDGLQVEGNKTAEVDLPSSRGNTQTWGLKVALLQRLLRSNGDPVAEKGTSAGAGDGPGAAAGDGAGAGPRKEAGGHEKRTRRGHRWQVEFMRMVAGDGVLRYWLQVIQESLASAPAPSSTASSAELIHGEGQGQGRGRGWGSKASWKLEAQLLLTVARVVSVAPVMVEELFHNGAVPLLRQILCDYIK
ncbi:unnamed protein product, partial [Discosporangium mesarthrocarpum]